jgi:demethylmenaquinone methyltransferase/2-methoxy-6-polyprenyl-1,4-benzoquinol methylase
MQAVGLFCHLASFSDASPKERSKMSNMKNKNSVVDTYQKQAVRYDFTLKLIDFFAFFGFNISGWRRQAISALNLKPGDTVVDLGCGTGTNFPLLYQAVTSTGKIIAVDISESMLDHAKRSVTSNNWTNFQLVCSDVAQFEFPSRVDAVVSAYTLVLVPDCKQVISNAHKSAIPVTAVGVSSLRREYI